MSRNYNILKLGNHKSKYSWRIRDLENNQTGTNFRKLKVNGLNLATTKLFSFEYHRIIK